MKNTRTYVHGTSYDNAMNIVNEGISKYKRTNYDYSDVDVIYCRYLDDDRGTSLLDCILDGQRAAAVQQSTSTKIGIVKIEIPEELIEELVKNEQPHNNNYQINIEQLQNYIRQRKIGIKIEFYENAYIPYFAPMYLAEESLKHLRIFDEKFEAAIEIAQKNTSTSFLNDIRNTGYFAYGRIINKIKLQEDRELSKNNDIDIER